VKPSLASRAQTIQPFLALVLIVAVRGVGLLAMVLTLRSPRSSVLPLRANEKATGTVAVTTIWSLVMLAVANSPLSMVAALLFWVATLPMLDGLASDLTVNASLLVQL